MTDLPPVEIADRLIEALEQAEALRSNADEHFTAVGVLATSTDEAALFEAVEKAGDIRVAADHSHRDFAAEQAIGGAAQDTENVVLVGREVVLHEELGGAAGKQVDGAGELNEDGFFGTWEGFGGAWCGSRHGIEDGRCNG
jgi:hypothetical protein